MRTRTDDATNPLRRGLLAFYAFVHRILAGAHRRWGTPAVAPLARQRVYGIVLLCAQVGITFTGAIVRVTGSGLGCPTWPECQPGSLIPVGGTTPWVHQAIEFGNRLLTFVVAVAAIACFLAVVRAGRRNSIIDLAFVQGIGIIVQAVLGGISVHLGLAWWSVAMHFLPSMALVFMAAVLVTKIGEPDDGRKRPFMPRPLRYLATGSAVLLGVTLVTGTMTTGAGPHAGDAAVRPEDRLQIPLIEIANLHAHGMYIYLGVTIGLLAGLIAVKVDVPLRRATLLLIAGIVVQAAVGIVQYWLGVPRWTVPLHVVGAGIVTAGTGFVWARRYRYVEGVAHHSGSLEGDSTLASSYDG
ncbi:COX15/CtaA family protein [Corynebacterium bovis]|uniref:Heme A synthase n=3 Tax=Corynebacterium bovis TaxID=36808 RepID=A0A3R8PLP2_9CORY|nr:COX15/CtaA family protein [Corynebacterium bovis]MBB3116425.1 cytochrome c oxidase assembly protein subunit 15 [Corynebacterium bovis DSM 20582 = CIP 54.80]MDK8509856.1 COX15/CtaA family protein [Corynebacterium bovis]MDN8578903.1 COX15/CtaA family protein [Corynebacterium bovis]QQC47788.1 heme A synthase [Corynebacterium bovis]RRO82357.1 heme A synthase [Corynebacterium bovis]